MYLLVWLWGCVFDGVWCVFDVNFVLDVDLWIVYVFVEVGWLWCECSYMVCGVLFVKCVFDVEMVIVLGFGFMLLLGLIGFKLVDG